jgi:integrase/recombinase XerC
MTLSNPDPPQETDDPRVAAAVTMLAAQGFTEEQVVALASRLLERDASPLIVAPPGSPTVGQVVNRARTRLTTKNKLGTLRTFETYFKQFEDEFGGLPVVRAWPKSELEDFVDGVVARAVERQATRAAARAAKGLTPRRSEGSGAGENCIAALRYLFQIVVDDDLLESNPAGRLKKPERSKKSTRAALTEEQLDEMFIAALKGGDDPQLDYLLLWFHLETGARQGGALALRLTDLDPDDLTVGLYEKGKKERSQPVSPQLMQTLQLHAAARGAQDAADPVFYYKGSHPPCCSTGHDDCRRPLTSRRYDTLFSRLRQELRWADKMGLSAHFLRHTAITMMERASGSYSVAKRFAGHADASDVTGTYIHVTEAHVAAAFSRLIGQRHPLAPATKDEDDQASGA